VTPPDDELPESPTTLAQIQQGLSIDERLWLARMIAAYGEEHVLRYWESYKMQIEYVRNF
jgi:hypothetical protein